MLAILGIASPSTTFAQYAPQKLNVSGALYNPGGTPVTQASVDFKIEILDKNATCVLYSEEHLGQNLSNSKGLFALEIGSGTSAQNYLQATTSLGWRVFANSGVASGAFAGCASGVTMNAGEERLIRISYNLGGGMTAMTPDVTVTSASYALVANTLEGKTAAEFVQVKDDGATDLNQSNVENVFSVANYAKLLQLLNNTFSAGYSFNNQRVTDVGAPTAATDAVNRNWTDGHVGDKTAVLTGIGAGVGNGSTLIWDAGGNQWITGTPSATDATKLPLAGGTMSGNITMGGFDLANVGNVFIGNQKRLQLGTYTTAQEPALVAGDRGTILYNTDLDTVRMWNGSAWTAVAPAGASGIAGGDLTGSYPNPSIKDNAVLAAKINSGFASNMLLSTNATTGDSITYVGCGLNQIMTFDAAGKWSCTTVMSLVGTSGVAAGMYGSTTTVPRFGVNAAGAVTTAVDVAIGFPVTQVAGKTGNVTLSAADIGGLGTAALEYVGTGAGNVPQLDAGGKILESLLPDTISRITQIDPGNGILVSGTASAKTISVDTGITANKILQLNGAGALGIGTASVTAGSILDLFSSGSNSSSLLLPRSTTADRPSAGVDGMIRYNTSLAKFEVYENGNWFNMATGSTGDNLGNHTATTAILAVTGTATVPSYSFAGDADSGLWGAGENGVAISTGGTERFRVGPTGKIGVGTDAPSYDLEVNGTSKVTWSLAGSGSAATPSFAFNNDPDTGIYRQGTDAVGIAAGGNVKAAFYSTMIGFWVPVSSWISNSNTYSPTGSAVVPGISLMQIHNTAASAVGGRGAGVYFTAANTNGNTNAYIAAVSPLTGYSPALVFGQQTASAAYAEKMRLDEGGNLGIGTAAPGALLDIYSTGATNSAIILPRDTDANRPTGVNGMLRYNTNSARFEGFENGVWTNMSPTGAGSGDFKADGSVAMTGAFRSIAGTQTTPGMTFVGDTGTGVWSPSAGSLALSNFGTESLRVSSAGAVGVGTSSPSAKFSVAGTATDSASFFYDNADVGDANDGQSLYVHRRAAEGDSYLKFNVDQYGYGSIAGSSGYLGITSGGSGILLNNSNWAPVGIGPGGLALGATWGGAGWNPALTHWGYITAAGAAKYTRFQINDTTDNYELTRQDASIGLFDIQMPAAFTGGNVGIGTTAPGALLDIYSTGSTASAIILPRDTAANRPSGVNGMIRYNSDTQKFEVYEGAWQNLLTAADGGPDNLGNHTATAQISALAGSVAAPGYSFSGDADTGLWAPAANTLAVSTLGTERVRIGSSPEAALNVSGGILINGLNAIRMPGNDVNSGGTVAIGASALQYLDALGTASFANTAVGYQTLSNAGLTTAAVGNTAVGYQAIQSNTSGDLNVGVGIYALKLNSSGYQNTAVGHRSLEGNTTGILNTSVGSWALRYIHGGHRNVAVGYAALFNADGAAYNTAVGTSAGGTISGGQSNTVVGYAVGNTTLISGSRNILVGTSAAVDTPAAGTNDFLNIGNAIFATGITGTLADPQGNVGIGTASPAARLDIYATGAASALIVPRETAAERPAGINGMIRYNSTSQKFEVYEGMWQNMIASGGDNLGSHSATQAIVAVTGTAATPSYTFSGDADTGLWNLGQNQLAFSAGGTDRMRIDSNGFVGIGSTAPATYFQLNTRATGGLPASSGATQSANGHMARIMSGGIVGIDIGMNNNGTAWWQVTAAGNHALNYGMTINPNGGNVGVNTNDPRSALDVGGVTGGVMTFSRYYDATALSGDRMGKIQFLNDDSDLTTQKIFADIEVQAAQDITTDAAAGNMIFRTTGVAAGGSPVERMRINSLGNMGIGTATPGALLDIYSTGSTASAVIIPRDTAANRPMGVNGMIRYNSTSQKFEVYEGMWQNMIASGGGGGGDNLGDHTATTQILSTNGTGSAPGYTFSGDTDTGFWNAGSNGLAISTGGTERARFSSLGQFGIGTAAPDSLLHVTGGAGQGAHIGSAFVGSWFSDANYAIFSHDSLKGDASRYALVQHSNASTNLNSGLQLRFSILNDEKMLIDSSGRVNVGGLTLPVNRFSVTPLATATGSAVQAGNTVTGTGTSWNSSMVGGHFIIGATYCGVITSVSSPTSLTVSTSQSIGPSTHRIHYSGIEVDSAGFVGIGSAGPASNLDVAGTGAIIVPRSTSAARPFGINGMIRYNTDSQKFEVYEGAWQAMLSSGGSGDDLGNHSATTAILAVTGTGAAPSYSFNGDTDTGLWNVGDNQLAVSTGGTERVRVMSNGYVGIGTTNPTQKLQVDGRIRLQEADIYNGFAVGEFRSDAGGVRLVSTHDSYSSYIMGAGNAGIILDYNANSATSYFFINRDCWTPGCSAELFRVMESGNVGIGTNAPGALLDIHSTGGFNSAIIVPRQAEANRPAGVNGMIRYNTDSQKFEVYEGTWQNMVASGSGADNLGNHTATMQILSTTGTAGAPGYSFDGDADTGVWKAGDNQMSFSTSGTERMRVDSLGRVGIGTATPGSMLHVGGDVQIQGDLDVLWNISAGYLDISRGDPAAYVPNGAAEFPYTTTHASIYNTSVTNGNFSLLELRNRNSSGNYQTAYIASVSTAGAGSYTPAVVFGQQIAGTAYAERMRIDSTGNIGIGTTAPNVLLDINSTGSTASAILIPRDTAANRPTGTNGMIRYNTDSQKFEVYEGSWQNMLSGGGGVSDNLGNHTATANIQLSGNYLSGDGNSEGLAINSSGEVSVISAQPTLNVGPSSAASENAYLNLFGKDSGTPHAAQLWADWGGGLNLRGSPNSGEVIFRDGYDNFTTMVITGTGNVGIGTSTPVAKLELAGTFVSQPSEPAAATVDLSTSNTQIVASPGGSTITLQNMVHGGQYTIIVSDTTSRTYTFSGCTSSYFRPTNTATTGGTQTIYGIITIKSGANWLCYISWSTGFN
jgi:hypothetical protein